jgi:SAM-dependent methyltransferase
MALIELADVLPLLVCPRCRSPLLRQEDAFCCSTSSCALSAPGSLPFAGGWPILVDFERSVLDPSTALTGAPVTAPRLSIERLPLRLRSLWKPRNRVAASNVEALLSLFPERPPLVLVIGGGTIGNGVEALYSQRARVVSFDIYGSPHVHILADAHDIPLADGSVDAVVVQAVLEHVLDPNRVVAEIHRVLRPRGVVYAETPFLQQVHAGAYDFTRYTASGHRYLFRAFEEISAGPVAGPGTQLLTSVDHLVRGLLRSELAGKLTRALFFWLRYIDRLVPPEYAMDNASAYYFLGRRSDRELLPTEIVAYYRGAQRPRAGSR